MSGIAGIIRFDGELASAAELEFMLGNISHRGPDRTGTLVQGQAALGHCLLATTPEALLEQQPLVSHDGNLVLVMDGRVDNWLELRESLCAHGVRLRGKTDDELMLEAYRLWGKDCLAHVDGDYALVIWDVRRRQAFCARDALGNRPFNYYWDGRRLVFASELHALLALEWVPERLDEATIAEFLADECVSRDTTFWQGVKRLPAAHRLTVSANGLTKQRYWLPDLFHRIEYTNEEDYAEHYRELLFDQVCRQSRSQTPLSFEVSGGLDSSALFAVADRLDKDQLLLAPGIGGFTLDFSHDDDANELGFCRDLGKFLGRQIAEIQPASPPLNWYEEWGAKYREYPGDPNGTMQLTLFQCAAATGSRVIFDGSGGDEWLDAGHSYYAEETWHGNWRQLARCFSTDSRNGGFMRGLNILVRHGALPLLPETVKSMLRRLLYNNYTQSKENWLLPELRLKLQARGIECTEDRGSKLRWPGQRAQLATLDSAFSSIGRLIMERLAMHCGLERRSPYMSKPMVQFAIAVPTRVLHSHEFTKSNHRRALRGLLPDSVRRRRCKAEFSVTYAPYFGSNKDSLGRSLLGLGSDWVDGPILGALCRKVIEDPSAYAAQYALWALFATITGTKPALILD